MKVKYLGCTDAQANWGHGDDPRRFLDAGGSYDVDRKEVHSWHTLYYLKGFHLPFNSVCFEEVDNEWR